MTTTPLKTPVDLTAPGPAADDDDDDDRKPLPLIGHLAPERQLSFLRWVLALAFLAIVVIGVTLMVLTNRWTTQLGAAAEMRVLSQKIAKSAQQVLSGQADAAKELSDARAQFAERVAALTGAGADAPPGNAKAAPAALANVQAIWASTAKNADDVLRHQGRIGQIS